MEQSNIVQFWKTSKEISADIVQLLDKYQDDYEGAFDDPSMAGQIMALINTMGAAHTGQPPEFIKLYDALVKMLLRVNEAHPKEARDGQSAS